MSSMNPEQLQNLLEAAIMVYGKPMSIDKLMQLFEEDKRPSTGEIREALSAINDSYADRGVELKEVASGFRFQAKQDYAEWITRLWEEKAPRYSRALLETLSLIAYRQPITRSEIEEVRGVAVSSHIIKTLLEREWVRVVGHRDVPGRPALYATTKDFLDYFNLKSLEDLPTLSEIRDLDKINAELDLEETGAEESEAESKAESDETSSGEDLAFSDGASGDGATQTEHGTETFEHSEAVEGNQNTDQSDDSSEPNAQKNDNQTEPLFKAPEGDTEVDFPEPDNELSFESDDEYIEASHASTDDLMQELDNTLQAVDALTSKKDLSEEEIIEQAEIDASPSLEADEQVFNDAYESQPVESGDDAEDDSDASGGTEGEEYSSEEQQHSDAADSELTDNNRQD